MNSFRIISRSLVAVMTVVLCNNVLAVDENVKNAVQFVWDYKVSLMSGAVADELCAEDEDAKKAAIDTGLYIIDRNGNRQLTAMQTQDARANYALNYSIRKIDRAFANNVVSFNTVAKKCDVLPEGRARDIIN